MSRIQMSHPVGETPANIFADFAWIKTNEQALLEHYGECSILVYEGRVIGSGESYFEAIANAEHNLEAHAGSITPVHYHLTRHRLALGLLRQKTAK